MEESPLKALGKFSHVTSTGNVVLRGGEIPELYSFVFKNSNKIGKVQDIIGPVSKPYILIKPVEGVAPDSFKNEILAGRRKESGKKGGVHRGLSGMRKQKSNQRL